MQWLALACNAENEILAWHDDLSLLESACSNDFRAICRIYGIDDLFAEQIKQGNLDLRLQFNGPRNTECIGHKKDMIMQTLSEVLTMRVAYMAELHQRIGHGYKRFIPVVDWQLEAYEEKYQQAIRIIKHLDASDSGMVEDYAEEAGVTLNVAAGIIINKYKNRKALVRKLERLRTRHQIAIRSATTKDDFMKVRASMEEDSFLSMLM
jgi:hypothetical protein